MAELLSKIKRFIGSVSSEYILSQVVDGVILSFFDLMSNEEFNQVINDDVDLWNITPVEWKALLGDDFLRQLTLKYEGQFTLQRVINLLAKNRSDKHKVLMENPRGTIWLQSQLHNLKANLKTEIKIARKLQ